MSMRRITWKSLWGLLRDCFSVAGVVGAVTALTSYFDQLKTVNDFIKTSAVLAGVAVLAIIWGVYKNWPRNRFEYKLNNKDILVRFVIGNILDQKDSAVIVPINDEFDAFLGGSVLKSDSIKAQVIRDYFSGNCDELGDQLKKQLRRDVYNNSRTGTTYRMGTTVAVERDKKRFYFSANSRKINEHRVESRDEDFVPTLSGIWAHLASYGAKGNVAIPILGTGNGRLSMAREEVFKEIVRSFIASCADKSYCDRLTIVIRREDVTRCNIDIDALNEFLRFNCKYASFASSHGTPVGRPANSAM